MGNAHKALLLSMEVWRLSGGKAFPRRSEKNVELPAFLMESHFYLKEVTKKGYSDFGSWQHLL